MHCLMGFWVISSNGCKTIVQRARVSDAHEHFKMIILE
jgi:hypothetical protein